MAATHALEEMLDFHVLLYQEEDVWLAHCLECDLVAQGGDEDSALEGVRNSLMALIGYAVEQSDLKPLYSPAPIELWTQYQVTAEAHGERELPFRTHETDRGGDAGGSGRGSRRRADSSPTLKAVAV